MIAPALRQLREYARSAFDQTRGDRFTSLQLAAAAVAPLFAGLIAAWLTRTFGVTHVSFVFMTSVMCAGAFFGVVPGLAAALVAFCIYNFFLVEPLFSWQFATADAFISLVLFFVAALLTGLLAGRLRAQVTFSRRQLATTEALFDAARALSRPLEPADIYEVLAQSAARALASPVYILTPSPAWRVAASSDPTQALGPSEIDDIIEAAAAPLIVRDGFAASALRDRDGVVVGVLATRAPNIGVDERNVLDSLSRLGAVALDRGALMAEMSKARALAETEQLRQALLNSLSHDFRTPLATILASATSLIDYERELDAAAKRDLIAAVRDETERLARFVSNLLDMTRLEAGQLRPRCVSANLFDIAADAVAHARRRAMERNIKIESAGQTFAPAQVDPVLLERAVLNLLENAIALSDQGGAIEVRVATSGSTSTIEIVDDGPGVPADSQDLIFSKFYRAPEHVGRSRGVGLGLPIAKSLVESMGGALTLRSPVAHERGAAFTIALAAEESPS